MTVYVDDMEMKATVRDGNRTVSGEWSHLWADTVEELEAFARRLGLRPEWVQNKSGFVHYDVVAGRRRLAIKLGAQQVSWRDTAIAVRKVRATRSETDATSPI